MNHTWNISRMMAFQRCPSYFNWRYRENVEPLSQNTKALDFGTAIHKALETWYAPSGWAKKHQPGPPTLNDEAALEAFLGALPDDHDEGVKETESGGYGLVLLRRYFEHYREMDEESIVRVIGLEREMIGKVGSNELVARLDMVVEMRGVAAGLWHVQHKTLSAYSSLEDYVRSQQLSLHERAYKVVAGQNDLPLKGTLLNVLRKLVVPTITRTVNKVKVKEQAKDLSDWMPFHRERLGIGAYLTGRFAADWHVLIKQVSECERLDTWPQNPQSCVHYNQLCPYYQLCMGHPLEREEWKQREEDYVDQREEEMKR